MEHKLQETANNVTYLDPEKEEELLLRLSQGDEKARKELIISHLPLALGETEKQRAKNINIDKDDLLGAALHGLVWATYKYRMEKEVRFSVCAWNWINGCIMEHIKIFSRTRIVPRRKIALYHDIQNELLKGSSWEEIKQKKNLTDEWISAILEAAPEISLQQPIANDKEKKIEDVAPDDQPEPEQMIAQKRASRHLEELLRSCLTPKQERVIRDRFGLNLEGKIYRLKEIGDHLSTSAEAIRQLQNKALEKLKGKKDEILYQFFET